MDMGIECISQCVGGVFKDKHEISINKVDSLKLSFNENLI
jgi:hypothetical protein